MACGGNQYGECDLPEPKPGRTFTDVSASGDVSILLSDGKVLACGANHYGQCNIPKLDNGLIYTQASAGGRHVVLLRSNGTVAAWTMYDSFA